MSSTPTQPSATSASEAPDQSKANKPIPPPNRRRDKPQLSCNFCRRRKLKCDRRQPCETCTNRGLSLSCTYVHGTPSERLNMPGPGASGTVQDRINQLEKQVISLMTSLRAAKRDGQTMSSESSSHPSSTSPPPLDEDEDDDLLDVQASELSDTFGRISLEGTETAYVESGHWTAILDQIADLKDFVEDKTRPSQNPMLFAPVPDGSGRDVLFGNHEPASKSEILAAMPERPVVDRLLASYFSIKDAVTSYLHGPSLLNQYEHFWRRPSETPIMWVGLLYGIISGTTLYQKVYQTDFNEASSIQAFADIKRVAMHYREKMIQCLILGNYRRCPPYTIEVLLLHLQIDLLSNQDAQVENWVLLGVIVRLALRMGYHRDPSLSARLTPFQAEMRRRAWLLIAQLDLFTSAQVGLPRMIREPQCDVAEPRNLYASDLHENMTELPPSRPDHEHTPVQALVMKNRVGAVFGQICDLTTSTKPYPYREVMRLDKALHDAYANVPEGLHWRSMSMSVMDDSTVILYRIFIVLTVHRSTCILHRRHMLAARTEPRYAYSRTACIDAALGTLEFQVILDSEMQPGGRLYLERWKLFSLVKYEFLLAITILCLDLDRDLTEKSPSPATPTSPNMPQDVSRMKAVVRALHTSYLIWLRSVDYSKEAQKVVEVLRLVLEKAQSRGIWSPSEDPALPARVEQAGSGIEATAMMALNPDLSRSSSISAQQSSSGIPDTAPAMLAFVADQSHTIHHREAYPSMSTSMGYDVNALIDSSSLGADYVDLVNWDVDFQTPPGMDDFLGAGNPNMDMGIGSMGVGGMSGMGVNVGMAPGYEDFEFAM